MDLLLLAKHRVGSEDLAGHQQASQGCQTRNFQGTTVGASARNRRVCVTKRLEANQEVGGEK